MLPFETTSPTRPGQPRLTILNACRMSVFLGNGQAFRADLRAYGAK
jgi:hypothetical protein